MLFQVFQLRKQVFWERCSSYERRCSSYERRCSSYGRRCGSYGRRCGIFSLSWCISSTNWCSFSTNWCSFNLPGVRCCFLAVFQQHLRRDIVGAARASLLDHQPLILDARQFLCNQFGTATRKLPVGDGVNRADLTQKDKRRTLVVVQLIRGKTLEPIKRFLRKEVAQEQTNRECRRCAIRLHRRTRQTAICVGVYMNGGISSCRLHKPRFDKLGQTFKL